MVQVRPSQAVLRPFISSTAPMRALQALQAQPSTVDLPHQSCTTFRPSSTTTNNQEHKQLTNSEVLLLEGDAFAVSHDGIARTGYHLGSSFFDAWYGSANGNPRFLAIEEQYDLTKAHKRFILREQSWGNHAAEDLNNQNYAPSVIGKQAQGVAPLGDQVLGSVDLQEIDEGTFGSAGTGATTWEASLAMGLFFASNPQLIQGDVLELGCGVGLGSILTRLGLMLSKEKAECQSRQHCSRINSVTLTDGNKLVLDQCLKNLQNNNALMHGNSHHSPSQCLPPLHVQQLRWDEAEKVKQRYDTIIACDVAYLHTQIRDLSHAMTHLLKEGGRIHIFGPHNRSALLELCRVLQNESGTDVSLQLIPMERYRLKPQRQTKRFELSETWDFQDVNSYDSKATATFLWLEASSTSKASSSSSRSAINDID